MDGSRVLAARAEEVAARDKLNGVMSERFQTSRTDWAAAETHPTDDELLLYLDGELAEAAGAMKSHLEACWACRVRAEKLQTAISDFIEYRQQFDVAQLLPPPRDWQTFTWQMREVAQEDLAAQPISRWAWWWGLRRFCEPRPALKWAATAALIALVVWLSLRSHSVLVVSASELLQNAGRAEVEQMRRVVAPVVHRKLQVRRLKAGHEETVRWETWGEAAGARFSQAAEDKHARHLITGKRAGDQTTPPLLRELQQVLRDNQFDWQRPLSATAYQAWRERLSDKREEVSVVEAQGQPRVLLLKTRVPTAPAPGRITEASLLVRASDWHPLEQRLRVKQTQGEEEYAISEIAFEVTSAHTLDPAIFAEASGSPVAPTLLAAEVAPPVETAAPDLTIVEAQVRETLHRLKADLGEPLEIVRTSSSQLEVRGLLNTAQRKQELSAALQNIPHLAINLKTLDEATREAAQKPQTSAAVVEESQEIGSAAPPIYELLEQRRPGQMDAEESRELANRALTNVEAAMAEAWALRRLAERYPASELAQLNPAARRKIEAIVRDHLQSLRAKAERARGTVKPLLLFVANDSTVTGDDWPGDWPGFANVIFKTVQQMERATSTLFAGMPADKSEAGIRLKRAERAARELLQAFAVLETRLPGLEKRLNGEFLSN
jgi:hypothetical protein